MLFLWFVLVFTLTESGCPCTTEISMIVSIFISLSHYALEIFAIGKLVNHREEYGLVIPTNLQSLHFIDLKRPLNWLKSKIIKIEENLNETVKHCPK